MDKEDDIPLYEPKRQYKNTLIFSGGGIRGICYVGVFKALEEFDLINKIHTFVGTSVGGLMMALHVIGYTAFEMEDFILKFDFEKIKNINLMNILTDFGIDSCLRLEYVIRRLIQVKSVGECVTLGELYAKTGKKLIMAATCLNTGCIEYLSHESNPEMPLIAAIKATIAIPWFYAPVRYNDKLYVDGGVIDNYPIHQFKNNLDEIVGVFVEEQIEEIQTFENLESFSFRVMQCFMHGSNWGCKKGYEDQTISINLESVSVIDYGISTDQKKALISIGYQKIISNKNMFIR